MICAAHDLKRVWCSCICWKRGCRGGGVWLSWSLLLVICMRRSCNSDLGTWAALKIRCLVVSKKKGCIDRNYLSAVPVSWCLLMFFVSQVSLGGMAPGIPCSIPQRSSASLGSACSSAVSCPNRLGSPTQIPTSIPHPTLLAGAPQVADAIIPFPSHHHLLSLFFLFSELVPWLFLVRFSFLLIVAPTQLYWLNMCGYGLCQGTVLSP